MLAEANSTSAYLVGMGAALTAYLRQGSQKDETALPTTLRLTHPLNNPIHLRELWPDGYPGYATLTGSRLLPGYPLLFSTEMGSILKLGKKQLSLKIQKKNSVPTVNLPGDGLRLSSPDGLP